MNVDVDTVVAIIAALSLLFVGIQIFQANRLQRNQVEQDYLKRALDVIHLPSLALQNLAFAIDDLRRVGDATAGSPPRYELLAAPLASYRDALTRFAGAVQDAIVFAEALERVHGTDEYRSVLAALKAANVKGSKHRHCSERSFGANSALPLWRKSRCLRLPFR